MTPVTRRAFLVAIPALVAGCSRSPKSAATPPALLDQQAARRAHLEALAATPVAADFQRTTAVPPHDLLKTAPELKGLARLTIRLHPRFGPEPEATRSKLGGTVLWHDDEPWPADAAGKLLAPVLHLRAEDCPPQVMFPPGMDLLQLFWNPRFPEAKPQTRLDAVVAWRSSRGLAGRPHPLADLASGVGNPGDVWTDYLPVPCRLAPERVLEFPGWDILPKPMRDKLTAALPGGEATYRDLLSVAPGTKVGGYAPALPDGRPPACPMCGWGMDYVLTVAEREWADAGAARWRPAEDAAVPLNAHAAGLSLGPAGGVSLFACRRCEAWPVAAVG